jgi:catechol 2,3-dioxygenase-like lactoylglutathione lyase family enzyme
LDLGPSIYRLASRGLFAPFGGLDELRTAVIDAAGVSAGRRVLELGCGPGDFTLLLSRRGATVHAVDASDAMLATAAEQAPAATFERADLRMYEPRGQFDVVLSVPPLEVAYRIESRDETFEESMQITSVVPQLRTTNLEESIRFYTTVLGGTFEFQYEDFYAGVRLGSQVVHLKLVDSPDPSIAIVRDGEHFDLYLSTDDAAAAAEELRGNGVRFVRELHETEWGTREFVIEDDQGHTLYFGSRVTKADVG